MTFIDITGSDPSPGLIAGYSILSAVSLVCTAWAIYLGRSRLHYHSSFSVRILFPVALALLTLENIALAISGLVYEKLENDGEDNNYDSYLFMKAIFVLQPFEVPLLLVVVFELTYLVHKSRSVNFCGMDFDEGRRLHNTAAISCMMRNSIRSLATVLLIVGLIVNLDVIQDDGTIDALVGRAGWHSFFTMEGNVKAKMHLLLSLLPVAVLVLVSFYLSIMLWRYGTKSSMVIHSSMCNPWFYPLFGTIAMGIGQIFGPSLYPVMSNAGILMFIITLLALMAEVDKDMVATHDVKNFLVQVANLGDEISVTPHPRAVQSVRQAYIDQPNNNCPCMPFRHSFRYDDEKSNRISDANKQLRSNGNKLIHRMSKDITEPRSNIKKAMSTSTNQQKAIIFENARNLSSSTDPAEKHEARTLQDMTEVVNMTSSHTKHTIQECEEIEASLESLDSKKEAVVKIVESAKDEPDVTQSIEDSHGNSIEVVASNDLDTNEQAVEKSERIIKELINDVDVFIKEEIGEANEIESSEVDYK